MNRAVVTALACGVLSAPAFALDEVQLATARSLHVAGHDLDALAILQPCLGDGARKAIKAAVLEECLFLGDETATSAVGRGPERDDGAFVRSMAEVGVTVTTALYGHDYDHGYLARLQVLFPTSKYSDHAAFFVNKHGDQNWEHVAAHLEGYLARFPKGIHARSALAHLAWIYDNAWEYTRPDSQDPQAAGYLGTDTGSPEKNAGKSEQYRSKAILYYERAIAHSQGRRDAAYARDSAQSLQERLAGLKARQSSGFVVLPELQD